MGFIKAETQPAYMPSAASQASGSHADHFAYLPFAPPSMDGLQPADLCKSGMGGDGRSKVARACTECKSRKMRCDGGLPFCGRCITHSRTKSCAYVDPPKRSPITRQYVSSLETQLEEANQRIAEYEAKVAAEASNDKSGGSTSTVPSKAKGTNAPKPSLTVTPADDADGQASSSSAVESSTDLVAPPTRSRAWTIAQEVGAADRDSFSSNTNKKRSRTHNGGVAEPDADNDSLSLDSSTVSRSLDTGQRPSLQTRRTFTSLRNVYPLPKSLVERSDDSLGGGSFIGLSTATAVLRVIGQLCKAAQTAPAAPRPQTFDALSSKDSDDGAAELRSERGDSPELTCETLVRTDDGSIDGQTNFARFSDHLLPSDIDSSLWSDTHRHAADALLEAYFELHHPAYPILHAATFRAQLRGELPRPSAETWSMLLNMVFALGSFESRQSADAPELDLHYYGLARKLYGTAIFSEPSVVTVQALALMSNYCQKRNFFSTSWMVLGSAIRMATSLELHLEKPASTKATTPLERELNCRLWWTLYTMEADAGLSFGRPNGFIGVPADVAFPRSIDDADIPAGSTDELPDANDDVPTRASALICHARFAADISLPIQDRLMRAPTPSIEEIRAFDLTIQDYVDKLPEFMQGSQLAKAPSWFTQAATRLRWRCNNLRMVMFRPFLLSAALSASVARQRGAVRPAQRPAVKQAIALCRKLAKDNVESIARYWDRHQHNQAASWHATYFLTQSAFIPLVSILDDPASSDASEWLAQLGSCRTLLEDMGTVTSAALKCRDLIQSVTAGLLDEHVAESRRAHEQQHGHGLHLGGQHPSFHHADHHQSGWLQSPADPAAIEPMFWAQPYAASASSDGTDLSDVGGPSSLAFSLGSVGSDGMPMFDLHSQIVQTSLEHRPSLAETIDAWTAVRPTTTGSQWSDAGSHASLSVDTRPNDAAPHQQQLGANAGPSFPRQRHSSSAASMTNTWAYNFHLSDSGQHQAQGQQQQQGSHDPCPEASLFAHFPATRSLVAPSQQQPPPPQQHQQQRPMSGDAEALSSSDGFGEPQWRHLAPAVPPHLQHQQHGSHDSWWSNLSDFAANNHHPHHAQQQQQQPPHGAAGCAPPLSSSNLNGAGAAHGHGNGGPSHGNATGNADAPPPQQDEHFFDPAAFTGF